MPPRKVRLGIDVTPMLPFWSKVLVKRKRWHDPGVLANPYVEATLLAPSPQMSNGWAVKTGDGRVMHVREAVLPSPLSEQAEMELREEENPGLSLEEVEPKRRITRKQKPPREPRVEFPDPKSYGPPIHDLVAAEDELYSPTTVAGEEGDENQMSGDEISGLEDDPNPKDPKDKGIMVKGLLESPDLDQKGLLKSRDLDQKRVLASGDLDSRVVGQNPKKLSGGGVLGGVQKVLGGVQKVLGGVQNKNQNWGVHETQRPFPRVNEEVIRKVGTVNLEKIEGLWQHEHQGLLNVLSEVLDEVPVDSDMGEMVGELVQRLQNNRLMLEKGLAEIRWVKELGTKNLCALQTSEKDEPLGNPQQPEDVLQTVTMALSEVRKNLGDWIEPMRAEYESLVSETKAVLPVDVNSLDPQKVEFVPGKMVCVVKAGPRGGRKKCRGVICGNMMESDPSPIGVYASGADGTLIRTVLRHSVLAGWGCDVTDIKTAFLLAPRVAATNQREAIVIPPKILVEAKICPPTERWRIQKALYGLPSSPACWALYRDRCMKSFEWEDQEFHYGMKQTAEGNLWEILEPPKMPQMVKGVKGGTERILDE